MQRAFRPLRPSTLALAALLLVGSEATVIGAQSPAPSPQPPPPSPPPPSAASASRAPALSLVHPPLGGTVPQDRPVIVFRFAATDPVDAVDLRTFAVTVDGEDRSSSFQVANGEAWGSLLRVSDGNPDGAANPGGSADSLAAGPHQVSARVCSVRGLCGTALATVIVAQAPSVGTRVAAPARESPSASRNRLLARLLDAVRRLLIP